MRSGFVALSSGAPPCSTAASGAWRNGFERRIVEQNELIVRPDNLHDTVNALVWRVFQRPNGRSARLMSRWGGRHCNGRPRRRDIPTLFDEAGALIISQRDDLRALHEAHEWKRLFVDHRARVHPRLPRHPVRSLHAGATRQQSASWPDGEGAVVTVACRGRFGCG